jgi:Zn-dependent protease with chaperone function
MAAPTDTGDAGSQSPAFSPDLAALMDEYRSVREEELIAVQGQISTLRYGIAGCVVLIGFAAQQHADRYLGWAVSLSLVPLVVLFSAIIWMGEYERGARAGHYVMGLERRINAIIDGRTDWPLRWEQWLRKGGDAPSRLVGGHHRYLAIACVFIGFQIASVVMGLHFYWHTHSHDPSRHWLIPVAVVVNIAILLMLLGYFRSSYEHLRDYTTGPDEPKPAVRQRVRMRLRLYSLFAAVGFISTPVFIWVLGIGIVWGLPAASLVTVVPVFWLFVPPFLWIAIIPLVSSRGLMRELFERRILSEQKLDEPTKGHLEAKGLLKQLTSWEVERLRMVPNDSLNASSMGRRRNIVVTTAALASEPDLAGVLAHEVGHHRLHHLYPLGLSYLYLWPYLYFDDRVRKQPRPGRSSRRRRWAAARALYSVIALPGWLAWVVLRVGWRTAEYDADRFSCALGHGKQLAHALQRDEERRQKMQPKKWHDYLERGRDRIREG